MGEFFGGWRDVNVPCAMPRHWGVWGDVNVPCTMPRQWMLGNTWVGGVMLTFLARCAVGLGLQLDSAPQPYRGCVGSHAKYLPLRQSSVGTKTPDQLCGVRIYLCLRYPAVQKLF